VRILFSSTPEFSHLGPLVPLARELQARGHEVLVACSPQLARWATRAGLRATACGLDLDPDHLNLGEAGIVLTLPDDLTPETQNSWATRAVFAEIFAPPMARDLRSIADEFQPDVMVRDRGEYAGWAVGTALDVPVVTVTFGRLADPDFDIDNAGDALTQLLGGQGLGADVDLMSLYAGPVLVPAPRSYAEPGIAVLPSVRFVQPMAQDASGDDFLPAWVEDLDGQPVVYVTLGNIFNNLLNSQSLFEALIEAVAAEPVDVIVTVGRSVDPEVFASPPVNVHIERYIPQSLLLPHVDVVACHGGYNTVIGALRHGIPLIVAPLGADQPVHARQCERLGAALVVNASPIDPGEVRAAAQTVLGDASYAAVARRIAEEIQTLPDLAATAEIIERLAPPDRPT
jgi:UDP:flavonoid glycosyltransferase YjiC (YdhE family)